MGKPKILSVFDNNTNYRKLNNPVLYADRNTITFSNEDLVLGVSPLAKGAIYRVYEEVAE